MKRNDDVKGRKSSPKHGMKQNDHVRSKAKNRSRKEKEKK